MTIDNDDPALSRCGTNDTGLLGGSRPALPPVFNIYQTGKITRSVPARALDDETALLVLSVRVLQNDYPGSLKQKDLAAELLERAADRAHAESTSGVIGFLSGIFVAACIFAGALLLGRLL